VYGEVMVPGANNRIFYAMMMDNPFPAHGRPGWRPFHPKLFTDAIDKAGANIPFPADGRYNKDMEDLCRGSSDYTGMGVCHFKCV